VLVALAVRRAFAEPDRAWRLVAVVVAALSAASVYGFMQRAGWDPFPWASTATVEYRGLPSTFGNPNFAGHALVPGIILALALATRPRLRIPALAAALLMAAHLWQTGMRGGPVAVGAALVLFGAWSAAGRLRGARPGRAALTLALTVLVGLVAAGALLSAYRATHATWLPVSDSSLVLRYNSAHGAARMVLEHPLTGVGPGNYERLNAAWWTPFEQRWYALRGLKNDHVHCEPLEAGAEGGLAGLFLHMLLFSWALLAGLRLAGNGPTSDLRRLGLTVALCAFAMGVDGLFGFNLHVPVSAGLFFLLLGVLDGVGGGPLPHRAFRSRFAGFAGAVLVLVLSVAVLAGAIGHFGADRAALRSQGMLEQLGALPVGDPGRPPLQNAVLQQLARDCQAFPTDPRFQESLGRVCLVAGYFGPAETAFSEAVTQYPANPEMLARLAMALHGQAGQRAGMGDWPGTAFLLQRAECAAERARELCPPLAAPHDALWRIADLRAETARQTGLDDAPQGQRAGAEAHAALQAGVVDTAPVYRTLARMALRASRRDEAAEYIGQALDQSPDAAETWRLVETLYAPTQESPLLLDAVSRAYGALKKDNAASPAFLRAAWWMARLCSNDPGLVLAVARDAIHAVPGEPGAWGLLAETAEGQARLAELICSERAELLAEIPGTTVPPLVDAVCADPSPSAGVVVRIAEACAGRALSLGGPDAPIRVKRELAWAVPLLKGAAAKCGGTPPEMAQIGAACANLFSAAAMWPEAEASCADALPTAEPEVRVTLHLIRANALAQLGRREEALAAAREAVQTAPGRMDVQWNLAQRLIETGNDQEAQFVYKMLLQNLPNNAPEYGRIAEEYTGVLQRLQASAPGGAP
jgi:tetratricopeptide (TPR) repeat protein/O-antigen ligase